MSTGLPFHCLSLAGTDESQHAQCHTHWMLHRFAAVFLVAGVDCTVSVCVCVLPGCARLFVVVAACRRQHSDNRFVALFVRLCVLMRVCVFHCREDGVVPGVMLMFAWPPPLDKFHNTSVLSCCRMSRERVLRLSCNASPFRCPSLSTGRTSFCIPALAQYISSQTCPYCAVYSSWMSCTCKTSSWYRCGWGMDGGREIHPNRCEGVDALLAHTSHIGSQPAGQASGPFTHSPITTALWFPCSQSTSHAEDMATGCTTATQPALMEQPPPNPLPTHEWRIPSSKGEHVQTPGSANRYTCSILFGTHIPCPPVPGTLLVQGTADIGPG